MWCVVEPIADRSSLPVPLTGWTALPVTRLGALGN